MFVSLRRYVVCLWPHSFSSLAYCIVAKLIFLKANLVMSPASLWACNNFSLYYTWNWTLLNYVCIATLPCLQGEALLSCSCTIWNMQSPWWKVYRRRKTKDSYVVSSLSTKNQITSPNASGMIRVIFHLPRAGGGHDFRECYFGRFSVVPARFQGLDAQLTAGSLFISLADCCLSGTAN